MYNLQGYTYTDSKCLPENTPSDVLYQLQSKVPPGYVEHYSTPSDWAKPTVDAAIADGIVPYILQREYQTPITRAQFCALAAAFYEDTTDAVISERSTFNDTTDINVQKMAGLGIVSGVGGGNFSPNSYLTREQAAVILSNLGEKLSVTLPGSSPDYSDASSIASWATAHVGKMQQSGIMSGTGGGNFSPKDYYTREQSIATVVRMESSFTPVSRIEVLDEIKLTEEGKIALPKVAVYPENATDKKVKYMIVDGNEYAQINGVFLCGIKPGKATLRITVGTEHIDIPFEVMSFLGMEEFPKEVTFLASYYFTYGGYEVGKITDIPSDKRVAGALTVTEASATHEKVTAKFYISDVRSGFGIDEKDNALFNPYLKFAVKNEAGEIVSSGVFYAPAKTQDDMDGKTVYEYSRRLIGLEKGVRYSLEFIQD